MPEKFKAAFNVQMAVPAWSVISSLLLGVFAAGAIYQKLNSLADSYGHTADKVTAISDRQITNEARLSSVQAEQQNHGARIAALERATWETRK